VHDDLEQRVRLLEAGQIVHDARLNEIEAWRRRDEPRTLQLVQDATVADEVRKALKERTRHEWSISQKIAAVVVALPTFAAGILALIAQVHQLFS
jgi:hypothetical protein